MQCVCGALLNCVAFKTRRISLPQRLRHLSWKTWRENQYLWKFKFIQMRKASSENSMNCWLISTLQGRGDCKWWQQAKSLKPAKTWPSALGGCELSWWAVLAAHALCTTSDPSRAGWTAWPIFSASPSKADSVVLTRMHNQPPSCKAGCEKEAWTLSKGLWLSGSQTSLCKKKPPRLLGSHAFLLNQ